MIGVDGGLCVDDDGGFDFCLVSVFDCADTGSVFDSTVPVPNCVGDGFDGVAAAGEGDLVLVCGCFAEVPCCAPVVCSTSTWRFVDRVRCIPLSNTLPCCSFLFCNTLGRLERACSF